MVRMGYFLVLVFSFCGWQSFSQTERVGAADDNETFWVGKLEAEGRHFRFVITVSSPSNAEPQASLLSLDEGERRFPLADLRVDESTLSFAITSSRAVYSAQIDPATGIAEGVWKQGGAELPLRLQRYNSLPDDTPKEVWQGTLKAGVRNLVMQFRIYQDSDGKRICYVDSLNEKVGGFIAKAIDADNPWNLEVPLLRSKFQGQVTAAGTVDGVWNQTLAFPLELHRLTADGANRIEPPSVVRPQTPQPPFPYESREVRFSSAVPSHELAGTLTLPSGDGPFPLAILISGSGPQERDCTILEHKPFWVLADHLTRQGIAVLRYDERGVGQSGGDFASATTQDFAADVQQAVQFARSLAQIDAAKVGLIGHSEGGLISALVGANDPELAWIVLMASPGVSGEQILLSQGQLIVAAEGGNSQQLHQQRRIQELVFESVRSNPAESWSSEIAQELAAKIVSAILEDESAELTDEDRAQLMIAVRSGLNQVQSPWFRFFLDFDPAASFAQVRCPVLALNGSVDLQVDPKLNLPKIEAALRAGGNTKSTFTELPGLNHLFQTCDTGTISRYAQIEETIAPLALETIASWIRNQTTTD